MNRGNGVFRRSAIPQFSRCLNRAFKRNNWSSVWCGCGAKLAYRNVASALIFDSGRFLLERLNLKGKVYCVGGIFASLFGGFCCFIELGILGGLLVFLKGLN